MHFFSPSTLAAIALAISGIMADTCQLSAINSAATIIAAPAQNAGGTSFSLDHGFALVINGGDPIELTPDNGNGFPPNYGCPDTPYPYYGYAPVSYTHLTLPTKRIV